MNDTEAWFGKGYEIPTDASRFFKWEDGDNTFRILSRPVMGYVYYDVDNKPHRLKDKPEETPADIRLDKENKPAKVKHFWVFLIYNYKTKNIQTLELTQTTIMKALKALIENPKWGNPEKYDITINKSGKDLLTKYAVVPNPHSELTPEVVDALAKSDIDLSKIFEE